MNIDDRTIWLTVVIVVLFMIVVYSLFFIQKMYHKLDLAKASAKGADQRQLQLTAYERLALFSERSKLANLITKLFQSSYSAKEMQQVLTGTIREEYEYNISQQLYVKPEIWEAVTKMKEQSIYIVNQVAASLPPNANALDLNKRLLELISSNPNVTMNTIVLDALQYETKVLLQ
jgi:hypothetical protein